MTYLDVLLVELHVVLDEALRLHPGALLTLQVIVVVVSSLHPVLHPLTAIITWTDSIRDCNILVKVRLKMTCFIS